MSIRSNREGQRLTLSWLDDLGIKEWDLQERRMWPPLVGKSTSPPSEPPAPESKKPSELAKERARQGLDEAIAQHGKDL